MKRSFEISDRQQQLTLTKNDQGYGFNFAIKKGGNWQTITSNNPFIWGKSFNLYADSVEKTGKAKFNLKGRKKPTGLENKKNIYSWKGQVSLLKSGWFEFSLQLAVPTTLKLCHQQETEPQLGFKLKNISVQVEGGFIWDQVLIENPACDFSGIQGSDLPAAYFFDPQLSSEMMIFLDWESFNWLSPKNLFGFLGSKCGLKSSLIKGTDQPFRQRFFGFWPQNRKYLGNQFPAGKQNFKFYFKVGLLKDSLNEWEALERLILNLTPFLKSKSNSKLKNNSWEKLSLSCTKELLINNKKCQVKLGDGNWGLRAYAQIGDFASPNPEDRIELMTQADLVWPLYFYQNQTKQKQALALYKNLLKTLPLFYNPETKFMANWSPLQDNLLHQDKETWYFLENGLVKLGWIVLLTGSNSLKKMFFQFAKQLVEVAASHSYLFPMSYDWHKKKDGNRGKNFTAGGLYSYGMCLAYRLNQDKKHLQEAIDSLNTIKQLPLNLLFHEPQQLSFAAAAACFLAKETGLKKWSKFSTRLIAQQLRMFYWYTDLDLLKTINCDCAGMVRSFPSKIYPVVKHNPAFKENVESILPWTYLLNNGLGNKELILLMLKFLNLVRLNNFYFFDTFHNRKDQSYIPLESLPALRGSGKRHQGGGVGHAIYGAGELLWLALIFESLAKTTDSQIMIANLDYLDLDSDINFDKQTFVVFNPTSKKKDFEISFTKPPMNSFKVKIGNCQFKQQKGFNLTLESEEYKYVTLVK